MQELWTILKKWRERPVVSFVLSQLARPIYRVAIWITRRVPWAIRVNGATVDFDGISLVFPTDVGITYCTLGWWQGVAGYEPATWQTLKFYFQQAEVFWDVGSNIGLYAVLAKKTNPSLRVEAFEPVAGPEAVQTPKQVGLPWAALPLRHLPGASNPWPTLPSRLHSSLSRSGGGRTWRRTQG